MIKIFKRFCAMFLVSLITLFSAASCQRQFEGGFFNYRLETYSIMLGARSDTDTFSKDDVRFELYYGLYNADHFDQERLDHWAKGESDVTFFAMYICDESEAPATANGLRFSDYKTIENHYFVKEISAAEGYTSEYGFTVHWAKGITYRHHETIVIPSDVFTKEKGTFLIKITPFHVEESEPRFCVSSDSSHWIEFGYEASGNTVKIIFKEKGK